VAVALLDKPDRNTRRGDVAIALVAAAAVTVGVWQEVIDAPHPEPLAVFAYVLGVVAAVPLLARRRYPLLAALACLAVVAAYHLAGYFGAAPAMASFVAVYSVGAYGEGSRAAWLAAAIGVATVIVVVIPPHAVSVGNGGVYGPASGMIVAAFVGDAMRRRTLDLHERLDRLDRQRRAENRSHVAEERIRIARDLHDIVAHTVAVITVQAAVAADALEARPDQSRVAIEVIRQAAREATQELRATVGVLRSIDTVDDPHAPVPSLDCIDRLLTHLPRLSVNIDIAGEHRHLNKAVDVAAYRIVQEALTNVVRHSGTTSARIHIRYQPTNVTIEVADSGQGARGDGHDGFGLIGMRERAAAVGGTVTTGPAAGGGFRVVAELPRERA
jgi:signal transduction histidine kinase